MFFREHRSIAVAVRPAFYYVTAISGVGQPVKYLARSMMISS
jgi:hypothetical protein